MRNKVTNIIIEGDLAKNVHKSKEIKKLGSVALGVLATSLVVATATAPITGGISYLVAAPIATSAGLPVATIIAVSIVGITVMTALVKDYEEIEYSLDPVRVVFKKKGK